MKRLALTATLLACSAPPAPSPSTLSCSSEDMNPYGVCYPRLTANVIPNFAFGGEIGSFRLAQLYDPEQRFPARLIHIADVPTWVGPASEEADFITGNDSTGANAKHACWACELSPKVVFIVVAPDSTTISGPPITDLQAWMAAHGNALSVATDPLAALIDGAAAPANFDVDPRTMQILTTTLGFDTNLDQTLQSLLASMK